MSVKLHRPLNHKYQTSLKTLQLQSSLFGPLVNDGDERFYNIDTRCGDAGGVADVGGRIGSSFGRRGSMKVVVREVWSMKNT